MRHVDPDGATGSAAIEQTFFLYEQGQIALEFQKTGAGAVASGNLSHRYLWGPAVDMLLADEQVDWSDSDADGEVLWALTDHLGTVRDVVDSSGELCLHRQFDAYGNVTNQIHYNAGGGVVTGGLGFVTEAFGYTGKFFDQWTGLQNNWNRWYDAATGGWVSQDPIGFAGGDANLSRYVGNSVANQRDPSGLYEIEWEGSNWTAPQKQMILDAMDAVKSRTEKLKGEIHAKLNGLDPCVRDKMMDQLGPTLDVLQGIIDGIASEGENLEISHSGLGGVDPVAKMDQPGWYGINGFWSDRELTLNDDAKPTTWESGSKQQLGETLFHELSHIYDTEDDDSRGPFMNAHLLDNFYSQPFGGVDWLHGLKKAKEDCERARREPRGGGPSIWPPTILGPYEDSSPFLPPMA